MSNIVESLYRTALNEMAIHEMPVIDGSNNDNIGHHIQSLKDLRSQVITLVNRVNNGRLKPTEVETTMYNNILVNLEEDLDNINYWTKNNVKSANLNTILELYRDCVQAYRKLIDENFGRDASKGSYNNLTKKYQERFTKLDSLVVEFAKKIGRY